MEARLESCTFHRTMHRHRIVTSSALGIALLLSSGCASTAVPVAMPPAAVTVGPAVPDRDYLLYAGSEATDRIAVIRFGPRGARVEREITVGIMPADADGPHGIAVS